MFSAVSCFSLKYVMLAFFCGFVAPVVTETTTKKLEDLIIQRIKDKVCFTVSFLVTYQVDITVSFLD